MGFIYDKSIISDKMKKIISPVSLVASNAIIILLLLINFQRVDAQPIYKCDNGKYFCYKNSDGKTIVKSKKYTIAFTDTIVSIGFVGNRKGKIIGIDNHGKELFEVYKIDNGPDFISDGMFRIIEKNGKVGFADTCGVTIIPPVFSYATPFRGGEAKVTFEGEEQKQGDYQYWESNRWLLITSSNLPDYSMSEMVTSTLFDTQTLTMEEKHRVKELAAQVSDSIKTRFSFLLYKWNFAIANNREMLLSSNIYSYSKLSEFHDLKSMGKQIIPLIMERLIDPSNFHLLVLYEAVQNDSRKIVKDQTGGEQNRAIMNVKKMAWQ